jgi:hypothetical protein
MEWWNGGPEKMVFIYLILCQKEFYNTPTSHFSKTHYSIIPLFHFSNSDLTARALQCQAGSS